jgi:hypothetical protein
MPRLMKQACLGAFALTCWGCSLDATPDASGSRDVSANAGRGALLASVSADSASPDPPPDTDPPQPTSGKEAGSPAATDRNTGAAGAQAEAMRQGAPSAPKTPTAGTMAMANPRDARDAEQDDGAHAALAGAAAPKAPEPGKAASAGATSQATQRCAPGNYSGTFAGTVQVLTLPVTGITGIVTAELVQNKAGDTLAIASSRVEGMADEKTSITAKLVGVVNCATLELEGGGLTEGVLKGRDLFNQDTSMMFSGSASAMYSSGPPALKGMWQAAPDSALSGSGTWSIALSPATP